MVKLGHHDMIVFLVALGAIMIIARLFAELFKTIKLPSVLGEIVFQKDHCEVNEQINLEWLKNGIYIIRSGSSSSN